MRIPSSHLAVILLAIVAVWAHQLVLAGWVVDDAAISFAYARNLATGEGLVVVPGGERVEGYSNPLWVGVLACFEGIGLSSRPVAKALALGLSALGVWQVYGIARRELPRDGLVLLAPVFFALNAQGAIWNASGLENALFTALLLGGVAATQRGWLGWAGACFSGLALTRPEGLAYGAVAGLWMVALHGRRSWRFWIVLLAPVAAHQGFRYLYFAWPLPNTYYAKVGMITGDRLSWNSRGWRQLAEWSRVSGVLWLLPMWIAAVARSWRWVVGGILVVVVALMVPWDSVGIALLLVVGLGLPLVASPGRGLCAHLVVVGLGFGVYADGDWMRGYRWMSLIAGPLAVLFALGMRSWIDGLRGWLGDVESEGTTAWVVAILGIGVLGPLNAEQTRVFAAHPVDYPEMIGRRLAYTERVADQLGLDSRFVSTLEMDMGAHMLDGQYTLVDLAGLVDVPISRHGLRDRAFFRQYVFEERKPTFAHVHKHWARISNIGGYPEWRRDYVELPPYRDGEHDHGGVHVRRDLILKSRWEGALVDGLPMGGGALELVGGEIRTPVAGTQMVVGLGVRAIGPSVRPVEVTLIGAESRRVQVPLGYGWIPADAWGDLVWEARIVVPVEGLVAGVYAVRVGVGDGVFDLGSVEVLEGVVLEGAVLEGVLEAGAAGRCEAAEAEGRRQVDRGFALSGRARSGLADCWAGRGGVADLERARLWDHWSPGFRAVAPGVAAGLFSEGLEARAAGDRAGAFRAFSGVVRVTPWDAWARRFAEENR